MKYLLTLLLIAICPLINAQKYIKKNAEPHGYDSRTVEMVYLITELGMGAEASLSTTAKNGLITQYGLAVDMGEFSDTKTDYTTILLSYGKLKTLYRSRQRELFFNAGGNGLLSYEMLKNNILDESTNKFSPGIAAKVELEYYIRNLAVTINAQQIYRPISEIGDWQWRAAIGLKYILN